MARKRRPTQIDIAQAAGVSPAVVSLVINDRVGKIRISEQTQARVWEAVRTLGYVPNLAARQLAGGRNHLLGVFTFDAAFPVDANNFYYPFLVGIEEMAEKLRYDLMLFTRATGPNGKRSIYRDGTNALQVADGSILLGGTEDRDQIARLREDGYPFVFVGRRTIAGEELDYVGADYAGGTREIVSHIHDHGHRRLLYLGNEHVNESAEDREAGFRAACGELGLGDPDTLIHRGLYPSPDWLSRQLREGITAFVVEHPRAAFDLIAVADQLRLSIPGDFSIGVLGNAGEADLDLPWITTFLIPRREMGAGAVRLLHDLLENADTTLERQHLLPCTLQPGTTVGPVPA